MSWRSYYLQIPIVQGESRSRVCMCERAQRLGPVPELNLATVGTIFGKFLTLFLASLVLGVATGLLSAIMLKRFNGSSTPQAGPFRMLP